MEKYFITKEQILELDKFAVQGCDNVIRDRLKLFFPEAFKKELQVGKWYKRPHNSALFYVTEILNIDSNYCKVFGFNNLGHWMPENAKTFPDNDFEATPKQVETALINQAKKRAYKKGVKVTPLYSDGSPYDNNNVKLLEDELSFDEHQNSLDFNNSSYRLFCQGKWAKIIPEETKVITMDKAIKILSKKYGKKVEIK